MHPDQPRRGARMALGLALIALAGTIAVAVPTGAVAAPVPGPAGTTAPASVGGPATAAATTPGASLAAVGIDLCAQVAYTAGFRGTPLVTAVAVAMAESTCNPSAAGSNGPTAGCPSGSVDRGLWQINNCYHPSYSSTCVYNAQCNAGAAYTISSAGTNWQPWSTYNSGAYAGYWSSAQAAVARLGTGNPPPGVTGTIVASPSLNVRTGPGTGYSYAGSANYGDVVSISCYTYGDYVGAGPWPSSTWDRITDPATGASGYAADTWISTTYDVKTMVGQC